MKKIIYKILIAIILCYFLGMILAANFNVANWPEGTREIIVVFMIISIIGIIMWQALIND